MREMKMIVAAVFLFAAMALSTNTAHSAEPFKLPPFVAISTMEVGTSNYTTVSFACEAITQRTGQKFRVLPGTTDVSRLSSLKAGAVHFIFTGVVGAFAGAGKEEFSTLSWGPQDLNIVWGAAFPGQTLIVRGDSGFKKASDFRGKRIAFIEGAPGSNIQVEAYLAAGGLTWNDVEIVKVASLTAGQTAVISGTVDAASVVTTGSVAYQAEASSHGVGFIPIPLDDEAAWERTRKVFPFWMKYTATIGPGLSQAKPLQCSTYGNPIGLAYANQNPDFVYWLAKNLAEAYPVYSAKAEIMKTNWTLEWNLELIANTAIPTHPGTIRYLKEIGKWTPELEARNEKLVQHKKDLLNLWNQARESAKKENIKDDNFPEYWGKIRASKGPEYNW